MLASALPDVSQLAELHDIVVLALKAVHDLLELWVLLFKALLELAEGKAPEFFAVEFDLVVTG